MGLPLSGEFIATESIGMSSVKRSRTRRFLCLAGMVWLLSITAAQASDNSKSSLDVSKLLASTPPSSLEVIQRLEANGSRPISYTPPPPIVIKQKPPSLQALKAQLAADQQLVATWQAALTQAQSMLAFWQEQDAENPMLSQGDTNVPIWTQAVASDQGLVTTVQTQIAQLQAQIAAAQ